VPEHVARKPDVSIPIEFPPHGGETIQARYVAEMSPARARLFAEKLAHMADLAEQLGEKYLTQTMGLTAPTTDPKAESTG